MDGKDVEIKKLWLCQTMENEGKIWGAKQTGKSGMKTYEGLRKKHEEEKDREDIKKIGQTPGILTQNDNAKLEWMYKGPSQLLNREEYLLGRAIDKNFEQLDAEEKVEKERQIIGVTVPKNHVEHECIPFSIRQYRNVQSTEQVDLQRKIMEDPLMLIKQKELETRKKILENPVKLKELHRILKNEEGSKVREKKPKRGKKKKKKKKKISSDSSDEELDKMLAKQYKKIHTFSKNGEIGKLDISKLLSVKYENKAKRSERRTKSKKRRASSSDSNSSYKIGGLDPAKEGKRSRIKKVSSRNNERILNEYQRNKPGISTLPKSKYPVDNKAYSPSREKDETKTSEVQQYHSSKERSNVLHNSTHDSRGKLSEKEKEQRRQEMVQNAIWRNEQRTLTVEKYRKEYDREREQHERSEFDKTFINKELQKAMLQQKTVESRIKSNINNIQRSSKAMDTNFVRR